MNYKNYVDRLISACKDRKWKIHRKKLNMDYNFLSIRINEGAEKSVCFSAGIHGDEPAGPEAMLKFIENSEVPEDVFVMLFPVVNPWGFDKKVRTNILRQDINRRFCDKVLIGEAKIAYGLLNKYPVNLFCSMHEWCGEKEFYMYASDKSKKRKLLSIPKMAGERFDIFDKRKINDEVVESGIIWHPDEGYDNIRSKCTLENKMYEDQVHYICLETPSRADLQDRVNCQYGIMKYLIKEMV